MRAHARTLDATSYELTGLTPRQPYRVRVRAVGGREGPWAHGTGTPTGKVFWVNPNHVLVPEGRAAELTVVLPETAPAGGLTFTLTPLYGTAANVRCDGLTKAAAADVVASPPTTLTVDGGETSGHVDIGLVSDLVTETSVLPSVSLSAPATVAEGSDVTVTATLTPDEGTTSGDYSTLSKIWIAAGETVGTGTVSTRRDSDENYESFRAGLGALPPEVQQGRTWVRIRIAPADIPVVWLSAAEPNPVTEGETLTVTARLKQALDPAAEVKIPLTAPGPAWVWLLPSASDPSRRGIVRVANLSGTAGEAVPGNCASHPKTPSRRTRNEHREPLSSTGPLEAKRFFPGGAIAEVQVDQTLIRDTALLRERTKVVDRVLVQSYGQLLLRFAQIGVFDRFRKVVRFLHCTKSEYCRRSDRSAFRAEMIRITFASWR